MESGFSFELYRRMEQRLLYMVQVNLMAKCIEMYQLLSSSVILIIKIIMLNLRLVQQIGFYQNIYENHIQEKRKGVNDYES